MRAVITDWEPRNIITTPLVGKPVFINSGIIKAVMDSGEMVSVGQIDYQEFDEENFQYIISLYWEIVDGLPASVFQGIPGIDMDLRLKHYYRANYIPTFISERTPSENREDLWELLESVGLDYYDRFEWLLRTDMCSGNDNLIVERRRMESKVFEYSDSIISDLQYGDKVIIENVDSIGKNSTALSENIFRLVSNGIEVEFRNGDSFINTESRQAMISYFIHHKLMKIQENADSRREGIEKAKSDGKYQGRKPIEVDEMVLREVAEELDKGLIKVEDAMRRTGISSRSTFYRKLKALNL